MSMSYAHGPSDVPLLGETIGANLRRTVERFGEREALVVAPPALPGHLPRAVARRSTARRAALLARGVGKGDRVGIWAPNRYEWVVTQFATARVGAILVTINPAYKAAELAHALGKAGVSLLVMARGFRQTDYVGDARRGPRSCRSCATRSCSRTTGRRSWPTARRSPTPSWPSARRRCDFDDPINIQYTSGTTGAPKGATLTHHNILNNAYFSGRALRLQRARPRLRPGAASTTRSGWCSAALPASRTARAWSCRASRSTPARCSRRSRPSAARRSTACRRCSSPSSSIRDFERFDLSSLRTGMMGGAPCPVEVMKQVRTRMHMEQVTIICGMTETSPVSTQTALDDPLDKRVDDRRPRAPARRDQDRRSRDRRDRPARRRRASSARAATASCSATGTTRRRPPTRSTPTAGCTAATSRSWTTTAT